MADKLPAEVETLIDKYAKQYGVDPKLAKALAIQESGGKQSARSKAGAIGVMQLMPSTANELGVDPKDMEQNIEGGIRHLSTMLEQNNGNVPFALAAYNAGQDNVDKYGGVPPFEETQGYVRNIMKNVGMDYAEPKKVDIPTGNALLQRFIAKKDRIAKLPPEVRDAVINRVYDLAVAPKIPKAFDEQQREMVKTNFLRGMTGQAPQQLPEETEKIAKAGGMPTGAFGVTRAGVMEGLGNILEFARREGYKLHYGDKGKPPSMEQLITKQDPFQTYASKGLVYGAEQWLKEQAKEQRAATAPYEARSKPHSIMGMPFTRADIESGGGKALSSAPIDLAMAELIPGAKGAKLLPKVLSGAGRGAVGGGVANIPFDPTRKGVTTGAVAGGVAGALGPLLGGLFRKIVPAPAAKAAATVAKPAAQETMESVVNLQKIAKDKFGKALDELSPQQKMEAVTEWKKQAAEATAKARAEATKAKTAARAEAVAKAGTVKADEKVAIRRAMDEAKALQKRIHDFYKTNKRAPTDEELIGLKKQAPAEAAPPPKAKPTEGLTKPAEGQSLEDFVKAQVGEFKKTYGRAPNEAEMERIRASAGKVHAGEVFEPRAKARDDFQRSMTEQINEVRKELRGSLNPEEKVFYEGKLQQLKEMAQKGISENFKVENPEALKAAAAVTDINKARDIVKIPEGVSGLSPEQQALSSKLDDALARLEATTDPKVKAQVQKTVDNLKEAMATGSKAAARKISEAERKAAGRATPTAGASLEEVAAGGKTPEEAVIDAEEEYYKAVEKLEAKGEKGKLAAKNLNKLQRAGKLSLQQAIELATKALGVLE